MRARSGPAAKSRATTRQPPPVGFFRRAVPQLSAQLSHRSCFVRCFRRRFDRRPAAGVVAAAFAAAAFAAAARAHQVRDGVYTPGNLFRTVHSAA